MAGILGTIGAPVFQLGGSAAFPVVGAQIPFSDIANWFTIGGGVASATGGQYIRLGRLNAQYQVTAGKTLIAPGFYTNSSSATGDFLEIGYADTALVAMDTATAPTNPKALWTPDTTQASTGLRAEGGGTASIRAWHPFPLIVPASKYLYFRVNGTGASIAVIFACKEI